MGEKPNERMVDPLELEDEPPPQAPAPAPAPAPQEPAQDAAAAEPRQEAARESPRGWAPPKRGWPVTLLFAALAVAGALIALYAWDLPPFGSAVQSTDNAYVRGQTTIISPQVS